MAESLDLYAEVAKIHDQVQDLNAKMDALLLVNGPRLKDAIVEALGKDEAMRQALLLVDGSRSQGEILKFLKDMGLPASKANVSRKFDVLSEDLGLIKLVDRTRAGKIYAWTPLVRALKIDRELAKGNGKVGK